MFDIKERYIEVYKEGIAVLQTMTPKGVDLEKYFVGDHKEVSGTMSAHSTAYSITL